MSSLPYPQTFRQFSLDEILSVTQNFDDALVVGEGGFGKVYKATINVENGATCIVAIKRLDHESSQGAPEFWAEIEMLTKLRHCNLVSLIGYCNDKPEMVLIYEFMPHGTLAGHLHKYGTSMSWVQRLNISIGAARGLHYLHTGIDTQHGVIHRDVKSSNILLDENYAAKISDFGLSKIGPINASRGTYVNTNIRGTFGYLDPEYFLTGRLTRKSDVFAFGVVLFELLCGRAALDDSVDEDECSLAKWAHESIEEGKMYEIIDSNIKSQISPKCLKVFVQNADHCLASESKKRPTMAEILVSLELSLTLQNKFDNRKKSDAGIMSVARIFKWPFISSEVNSGIYTHIHILCLSHESIRLRPFISSEVNSAQSDSKLSTDNEDTIKHSSSSKENRLNHVAAQNDSKLPTDNEDTIKHSSSSKENRLNHVADNINNAFSSKDHSDDDDAEILKEFSFDDIRRATRNFSHDRRLGGGEFGGVFEGLIEDTNTSSLSVDGILRIAVKRFYNSTSELQRIENRVSFDDGTDWQKT
ncbi:hypothetical protein SSX86_015250 [Deinandra increscens subsp. villosa]|uniref:Protein kinase domain-containing protein n=1 Tax=Deinandra increscens subsp. villosa TaxID=3103831 RepID=A0AAP0GYQ8_9ASTR